MAAVSPSLPSTLPPVEAGEPSRYRCLVLAIQLPDGKGDVAVASQIADLIRNRVRNGEVAFAYTQPRPTVFEEMFLMKHPRVTLTPEEERGWRVVPFREVEERLRTFDDVVIFPSFGDSQLPPQVLEEGRHLVKLREYGAGRHIEEITQGPTYTLGLNRDEHGVLLYRDLYRYQLEHRNDPSVLKLRQLATLPGPFKAAILNADPSLSFEEAVADFNQKGKLYSSYGFAPEMMATFAEALCRVEASGDITICFMNQKTDISYPKILHKALHKNGFERIEVWAEKEGLLQPVEKLAFKQGAKGNRKLRIIFQTLKPTDADTLLKASEPETHFSGDSSLFKALALEKYPSYFVRDHKIALARDLIEIASTKSRELAVLLRHCFYGDNDPKSQQVDVRSISTGTTTFFKAMRSREDLRLAWQETIAEIHATRDFADKLPTLLPSI